MSSWSSRLPADLTPNAAARALEALRARHVRVIDLTESNPTQVGFDYPPDLLAPLGDARGLLYEPSPLGLLAAREAVASEFGRRGMAVAADHVALTASTSEAYALLFKLLCDAGDAVLVPRPSYPLFEHLTRLECVELAAYDLEHHGAWRIDLDQLKARFHPGVRAILVVSPNNPTGSFLHQDDLTAIVELAAERGAVLIGDEVFADYPLDAAPHRASVLQQDAVPAFALGGLSKSAGLPQVKLGWMAVCGPSAAVNDLMARYEVVADTYLSVSTPVQVAASSLIDRGSHIRRQIGQRIARNLDALRAAAVRFPSVKVLGVEGGWSVVLEVPATRSEEALVLDLLEQDGVLAHPGYFFDFRREAFLVVSLLADPDAFDAGIARLLTRAAGEAAR
jgi:aspartate/methionine/tyrosine aminotransferase